MSAFTVKMSTKYHKRKPSANHIPSTPNTSLTFHHPDISNTAKYQPEKLTSIENYPINRDRHIFLEEKSVIPPPETDCMPRARQPRDTKTDHREQMVKKCQNNKISSDQYPNDKNRFTIFAN